MKGKDLFDASIWSDPLRTSVFYTFATSLRQRIRDCEPTTSHRFIGHLRDRGKLVRCYTQNIDMIEEKVGLSTSLQDGPGSKGRFSRRSTANANQLSKMVDEVTDGRGGPGPSASQSQSDDGIGTSADTESSQAEPLKAPKMEAPRLSGVECVFLHGSLECLRCFRCGLNTTWDDGREVETMSGQQPECPHCIGVTVAREERGKRALGVGKLRPDIVLYGEEHPNAHLIGPIVTHDISICPDLLLILGTSLRVHGLKVMVREFANAIHNRGGKVVFVNFTKPPESSWGDFIDYWVQWDCDAWVGDLQNRVPKLWETPQLPKEKPPAKNPVAMRDSRANGAWVNKKILDELSRITESRALPSSPSDPDVRGAIKISQKAEKRLSIEETIQVQTTGVLEEDPTKETVIIMQDAEITASSDACVVEATIEVSQKQIVASKAAKPKRARKSAPGALERGRKKPSSTLNPNHGRASKIVVSQELKLQPDAPLSDSIEPSISSPPVRELDTMLGSISRSVKDTPRARKRKRIYGDEDAERPAPKLPSNTTLLTDNQLGKPDEPIDDALNNAPNPPKKVIKAKSGNTDSTELCLPSLQNMQPPPTLQNGQSLPPMQNMQLATSPQLEPRPPTIEPLSPPQGPCSQFGRGIRRISANMQREIDDGRRAAQMHLDIMDRKFKWQPFYRPQDGQAIALTPAPAPAPESLTPLPPPPPTPQQQEPLAPIRVVDAKDNEAAMSMVQMRWSHWHKFKDTVTDWLPIGR